ncbi:vitamin K epoxide reductase family protein [Hymenobacter arizonensis]|uniref:Vitamin K epoxide reductase family protein n=1 Tax=Hymenobacter arizonensis TaxID=1227077 RepID=A0A1I5UNN1_HYMAR|nr:vitamin K epoxide reductase family protein [Hymenobacter arizonensis]SFP96865.1 Vitamin K epoxide reductase family protein [Hymenobacter arizonensis]
MPNPSPLQLSHELREGVSSDLTRRRWIIGLSLFGTAMGQIVSLYQTGIIKHLPDPPPHSLFNADKVDASTYAYKRMATPDALLMVVNYGITAALASAGGEHRAIQSPLLPVAMGVKTLIDTGTAVKLGQEEWQENKALCAYCQVATIASIASVVLAAPELIKAVKQLFGRRTQPAIANN